MEALPYIKAYHGKTVVIKYGGGAMVNDALKESIASDIVLMKLVGISPVIVHGGGPDITAFMGRLDLPVEFVGGLRKTDAQTMEVVKMVLVGKINKELVSRINQHGRMAVGLSGDDAGLIVARKKEHEPDLGFVGEVDSVNGRLLADLIKDGYVPVIASIGAGPGGQSYNINADTVAAEVAAEIKADKIIFLTDVEGLYRDFKQEHSLISVLSHDHCREMIAGGEIEGGMLPKVKGCLRAIEAGVGRAHILNGTIQHAMLLEIFTNEGIGTMISRADAAGADITASSALELEQ
jgi:acetylglutamate kinase